MIVRRTFGLAIVVILGMVGIIGSGTAPQQQAPMRSGSVSNKFFDANVTAHRNSFTLSIQNKTSQDLEVDWNKTLYISSGTTSGGFMFEGVVYANRNNPKPPDIVFANGKFSKVIHPNNLVSYTSGKYGGWSHDSIGFGDTGVYLTIKAGNEEIKEKIIVK
jgi:hypothetical protein